MITEITTALSSNQLPELRKIVTIAQVGDTVNLPSLIPAFAGDLVAFKCTAKEGVDVAFDILFCKVLVGKLTLTQTVAGAIIPRVEIDR